jgi:hypothetical protein
MIRPNPHYFGRHWSWPKEWKYWREWTAAKQVLMTRAPEDSSKETDNRLRHEFTVKAIGHDKSHYDLTNPEFDHFLRACYALTQPDNLTAQIEQLSGELKRARGGLRQTMREMNVGDAYVGKIAHTMSLKGKISSADVDVLDAPELRKVTANLRRTQAAREKKSGRIYILEPA